MICSCAQPERFRLLPPLNRHPLDEQSKHTRLGCELEKTLQARQPKPSLGLYRRYEAFLYLKATSMRSWRSACLLYFNSDKYATTSRISNGERMSGMGGMLLIVLTLIDLTLVLETERTSPSVRRKNICVASSLSFCPSN